MRVEDAAGAPLGEATVSWSPLPAADGLSPDTGRSWLRQNTVFATTDARGLARLDCAAATDAASALWVSHPGHLARFESLGAGALSAASVVDVTLEATPAIEALVLGSDGRPCPDALVEQQGVTLAEERWLAGGPSEARLSADALDLPLLAFFRTARTDAEGRCLLHPIEAASWARARTVDGLSEPARASPGVAQVVLRLAPQVRAAGTVHLPAGDGPQAAHVSCSTRAMGSVTERYDRPLARVAVRADGSWGPVEIPARPDEELVFRLAGGGLVSLEEVRRAPAPGELLVVDFDPERGLEIEVTVTDRETGGPVAGARATFWWTIGDSVYGRVWAWTDAQGHALVRGVPHTTGWMRVDAARYREAEETGVGTPRPTGVQFALEPAGVLRGVCLSGGLPVEDFDVAIWSASPGDRSVHHFRGSPDGHFELREAPLGGVSLVAFSPAHPECQVVEAWIEEGRPAEVTLELPAPIVGVGRVVDALTGRAVPDARVLPYVCSGWNAVTRRGSTFQVGPDGHFELEVFPPKETRIAVEAPGYSPRGVMGSLRSDGTIDFGQIGLTRGQDLTVRLLAGDGFDASDLWFLAEGARPIEFTKFPADGVLEIPDVRAGLYDFYIVWPNTDSLGFRHELIAGAPWVIDVPFQPEPALLVEVEALDGGEIPAGLIHLKSAGPSGTTLIQTKDLAAEIEFRHCPASAVEVQAWHDGELLGLTQATFAGDGPRHVRLELGGAELFVEVLDGDGAPLAEANVRLFAPGPPGFLVPGTTNADGLARFTGLEPGDAFVSVYHAVAGYLEDVPVRIEPGTGSALIEFGEVHDLRLRAIDAGTPLAGVKLALHSAHRINSIEERTTGPDGVALFTNVSPASLQVRVDQAGCWRDWHAFEFDGQVDPIEVPVRRTGALRLSTADAQGAPLAGVPLAVASLELDADVADWVAEHRVAATPPALVSGPTGAMALEGLPRGPYLVRWNGLDGDPRERTVEVPPLGTAEETLSVE